MRRERATASGDCSFKESKIEAPGHSWDIVFVDHAIDDLDPWSGQRDKLLRWYAVLHAPQFPADTLLLRSTSE